MRRINFVTLCLVVITLALFLVTGKAYQNQALSFHFVDEEDSIVLGNYLLQGEKLYSDLFSHHQPLAYILSAGVSETTNPNTLYLLIKRHREAIIAWSFVWGLFLVWRFRFVGLGLLIIYELLKVFLLGNLFLSESLVAYPLAYLLFWVFLDKKLFSWELIILGISLSLSFLLLSPLWPLLAVLSLIIFWRIKRENSRKLNYLAGFCGGLIPVILVLPFISLPDYFFNAFYINFNYYIPMTSKDSWILTAVKAFLSPVIALTNFQNGNATLQAMKMLSALLMLNWIMLIRKGNFKLPLMMALLLGLANIRFVLPGEQEYSGFHIIPWFVSLIVLTFVSVVFVLEIQSGVYRKLRSIWGLGVVGILLGVIIFKESGQAFFQEREMGRDFYINYSRQADFGEAVKIMKNSGDKLFIAPDEWLIYWQAGIPHASKMVNYYAWMSDVKEIKDPLHEIFIKNPPTFFYCDRCELGYFGLEQFFPNYQRVVKDGKTTSLMVLKERLKSLNQAQIEKLNYYGFGIKEIRAEDQSLLQ